MLNIIVINETQNHTTIRYHFISARMARIKLKKKNTGVGEDVEKLELLVGT